MRSRKRQRGVALLTVLLIFAVLAALAVRMSSNHSLLIAQSQNQTGIELAMNYALGAEELARQALHQDYIQGGSTQFDHREELWAKTLPPFEVDEGGFVTVQIDDLNGCFNVNALEASNESDQQAMAALKRLLRDTGLPDGIADSIKDWVDADSAPTNFGAEDNVYELAEPPYRAPNQRMGDVSELRLVSGVEPVHMPLLFGLLCALPTSSLSLNVNTAYPAVLQALPNPEENAAPDLTALDQTPRQYEDVSEFLQEYEAFQPVSGLLSVSSDYFLVQVHAQVGDAVTILSSVVHRDVQGKVTVRSRDFGRDFRYRITGEEE